MGRSDVPPRETSPAAKSEEKLTKRMFSQATGLLDLHNSSFSLIVLLIQTVRVN